MTARRSGQRCHRRRSLQSRSACQPYPDLPGGIHVGLLDHLDLRLDPATVGWFAGHPAGQLEMRGWLRLRDGTQPDPLVLALAVDALPPTVFGLGRLGWAPTIELTFLLRALPARGWLSVRLRGRLVQDGWFDEEAEVYDSVGRLVARSGASSPGWAGSRTGQASDAGVVLASTTVTDISLSSR